MNNVYFIESDNHKLIELKIKEILKANNLDSDYLVTYDMEEENISKAILDLDTYDFFGNKKVVYCKNATFLTTTKDFIEHDFDFLTKYLKSFSFF